MLHCFFFLKNGPSPASFSFIFCIFQTNINTILQQINVKKSPSSIWHWDSNPRPSERESPPITTRPGLPPLNVWIFVLIVLYNKFWVHQFSTWVDPVLHLLLLKRSICTHTLSSGEGSTVLHF